MERFAALVEAVLFLETEPIDVAMLSHITKRSEDEVRLGLEQLHRRYGLPDSGLELSEEGGGFRITPRRDLLLELKDHYGRKTDEKLSKAALETLSIIAYSQPITRAEVESIRGLNSSTTLKILQEKGYVRELGRKDGPGRPVQYGTTKEFLQWFGLSSISDLPKLDDAERERFELSEN